MRYSVRMSPRAEREATIAKRVAASKVKAEPIFNFRGGTHTPVLISLPVDMLVYRMENCRTFGAQQTEIAREGLAKDFFEKGQEITTAQQAQHAILASLAKQGSESVTPVISVLEDEGQREPLLITSTGVVVNGNRRLAAMRELSFRKDGSRDDRFLNIDVAVLPTDITRDEVDDIEADLQAKRETKLDYDWIGDAQLIRRQVSKENRTTKAVAERLRRSKQDIENSLQALDEADLYLSEWIEKPGEYEEVLAGQQIFGDLPKALAKKDVNLQNASRAIAWSIYENRDKISGRVYRLNPAFGKLAPKVIELLEERLELPTQSEDDFGGDDFAIEIDVDDAVPDYSGVIEALRDDIDRDETVNTLVDACETAIELANGQRNEEAALRTLALVNSKLTGLDAHTAGEATLTAMIKQIQSIRSGLSKIETVVNQRLSEKTGNEG